MALESGVLETAAEGLKGFSRLAREAGGLGFRGLGFI